MSRSIQLVLLCVATLSYIQLGRADCNVTNITAEVRKAILPYINTIKDDIIEDLKQLEKGIDTTSESTKGDLSSVRRELASLEELMKRINDKIGEGVEPSVPICDGTGGWRPVINLDMTNPNTHCPEGWAPTNYSKRTCGRATDNHGTCDSATFSVGGGEYSQVCGRIKAYQWGQTRGFTGYGVGYTLIDDPYFSGVGVMHGSPRQHIWSFAAGSMKNNPYPSNTRCPCDTTYNVTIPPFVGEDYFCGSGYKYDPKFRDLYSLHSNNTLWDGKDCRSSSSQRYRPYFTKTLDTSTTDDIELRMCHYYDKRNENIAVELIELYVK